MPFRVWVAASLKPLGSMKTPLQFSSRVVDLVSSVFAAVVLGGAYGAGVGAMEGAPLGASYAVVETLRDAKVIGATETNVIGSFGLGAYLGAICGMVVGFAVGALSFVVVEIARSVTRRNRFGINIERIVSFAAQFAFLGGVCGLAIGLSLSKARPSDLHSAAVLLSLSGWSSGFLFGTLLGGLCSQAPQVGIAPVDALLRRIWRD